MRVLVIGYGSMGRRHAANARALGAKVVVHDSLPDKFAEAEDDGFNGEAAIGADTGVDAVVVATPADSHYRVATEALFSWGPVPLLVEKPLDVTLDHDDFWRSWPHPTAMVGYNWRFHSEVLEWRQQVAEWVGDAYRYKLLCASNVADWPGEWYAAPWLEFSHEVDLLRWLRGGDLGDVLDGQWWQDAAGDPVGLNVYYGTDMADLVWETDSPQRRYSAWLLPERNEWATVWPASTGDALGASYRAEMAAFLNAASVGEPVPGAATFEDGLAAVGDCLRAVEFATGSYSIVANAAGPRRGEGEEA